MVDGDMVEPGPCESGGDVLRAAVRWSHSFCWVRDGGSPPGGLGGGDVFVLFEVAPWPGEGGV